MEFNPHDLVRFKNACDIIIDSAKPEWAIESLVRAPVAVVRRAPIIRSVVPVGIRGGSRNQRLAGVIELDNIIQRIAPEELTLSKSWKTNKHLEEIGISHALEFLDSILTQEGLKWGPTGSVGFELVSGIFTVTENSDLDIVIRVPKFMSSDSSRELLFKLQRSPIKVDVQLETSKGCVILAEYARGESLIMLRTTYGPRLVKNPWI